jgi:hypothetical protein
VKAKSKHQKEKAKSKATKKNSLRREINEKTNNQYNSCASASNGTRFTGYGSPRGE